MNYIIDATPALRALPRDDFDHAFPHTREPRLAYVHVANDDGPLWPWTRFGVGERVGVVAGAVTGTIAILTAMIGVRFV